MQYQEYQALVKEGHSRIPVYRKVFADLDTPLSAYLKLADAPYTCLFESVDGGEMWGRYSFIGLPAKRVYMFYGHELRIEEYGCEIERRTVADPLAFITELQAAYQVPELANMPRFTGGFVGYFGYETIQFIEPRLSKVANPDLLGTPDILLMLAEEVAVFDNLSGKLFLIINIDPRTEHAWEKSQHRLDQLQHHLRNGSPGYTTSKSGDSLSESDFVSGFSQVEFEKAVNTIKEYIAAGDIMQAVLSQRLTVPFRSRPIDVYRALRSLNPSPYMFFLDLGKTQVVGASPEILVRCEGNTISVRPLAGTRPRGETEAEDLQFEQDLLQDPKEIAEHVMLIDLGRNDIGRVSKTGSVKLIEKMAIEKYSHVMHIVSHVSGEINDDCSAMDVLKATFPAGTLSGAAKVRAMEIIAELEPVKRNIYAGAVGYISFSGDMDTAIAIRTAVIQDGQLHVQAGAGIVADSDPTQEWEETMNKGRALFHAVASAVKGLG